MHIVHLVCSPAFAGVEQHMLTTAIEQAKTERVSVIGGDPKAMRPGLEAAGVQWYPGGSRAEAWRSLRGIESYDILATHMTDADVVGAFAHTKGSKVISTRHFAAPRGSSPLAKAIARVVNPRIDAQISISQFVADRVEGDSTVIYNGVLVAEESATAREKTVLVMQRLEPEKDTGLALAAWELSQARANGYKLVIGGRGALTDDLVADARRRGISDSVEFAGFIEDPGALLDQVSIVVATAPSEPLGLVVLEAMAHGVAVIASDGGGHRETVGSVNTAHMFPPHNAAALAAQIDSLAADAGAREAYGAELRARQREAFTIAHQVEQGLALYRAVLA